MKLLSFCCIAILLPCLSLAQDLKTERVVLVTLDGYRWQELFEGADQKMIFRDKYVKDESVREKFWAETCEERREKLMPFMWKVVGSQGQLYGNRNFKNRMKVSNRVVLSYPGYSEMLVGFVDKKVKNNDPVSNPNMTVLEAINNHHQHINTVAAFSTWKVMDKVLREEYSGIPVNSGLDKAEGDSLTSREAELNELTDIDKNPHGDRYDQYTFGYALEYMRREDPHVVFISFDETDEHGHRARYGEYLHAAHKADSLLDALWNFIQSDERYRDKTTLIVSTDHGRGNVPWLFNKHAILARGSAHIWMAVIGPDTPADGEMKRKMKLEQKQIAPTIANFMGVDYQNRAPVAAPIMSAFKGELLEQPEPDFASGE